MMALPGPLVTPWAQVVSVHCVGSYWAPGFSNYLLLFQVTIKYYNPISYESKLEGLFVSNGVVDWIPQ